MAWHDGPKQRNHPDVDAYIAALSDEQRVIYDTVRSLIKQDPGVLEFIAWSVPCFAKDGPLLYLSAAKNHVTLGFFRGMEIGSGLQGTGKSPVAKHVWKLGKPAPAELAHWISGALAMDALGED